MLAVVGTNAAGEGLLPGARADRVAAVMLALMTLLVHELGHAAAAARYRQPPRRIGLTLFGGLLPAMFVDIAVRGELAPGPAAVLAIAGSWSQVVVAGLLASLALLLPPAAPVLVMAALATCALALLQLVPLPGSDGDDLLQALRRGIASH